MIPRMPDEKPTLDYDRPKKPEPKLYEENFWGMAFGEIFAAILTYILLPFVIFYLIPSGCFSHAR